MIRDFSGNQCRDLSTGVMCSYCSVLVIHVMRAAVFWTFCNLGGSFAAVPARRALFQSNLSVTNARTRDVAAL